MIVVINFSKVYDSITISLPSDHPIPNIGDTIIVKIQPKGQLSSNMLVRVRAREWIFDLSGVILDCSNLTKRSIK